MSFIKNKQKRYQEHTKTSLGNIIELEGDLYVVTGLDPLELTDIEHYGRETTGDTE